MIGFLILFVAGVRRVCPGRPGDVHARMQVFSQVPGDRRGPGRDPRGGPGALLLMFLTIILDQFFLRPAYAPDADELPLLADLWTAINDSGIGKILHETVIPNFLAIVQFLVPQGILGALRGRVTEVRHGTPARPARWRPANLPARRSWPATRWPRLVRSSARSSCASRIASPVTPGGRAGSWRSRRTSAPTIAPRTRAWAQRRATGSCSGLRASPTSTLSTACITA